MISYIGSTEVPQALTLTERIYALEEPWRSRFLKLVAAGAHIQDFDTVPSRDEVRAWLRDEALNEQVRMMLRSWTHAT